MKTAERKSGGEGGKASAGARPSAGRRIPAGMTLIELLVAFVVLLMLIAALVTLTTRSLETWTSGEARKDMYDRAQVAIDLISADLRNLY
ncbi:MAG TPA: prepilin-type N-terminal cleavage/methylation domain-containing protein, partial [Planctomycetota bacterium]|nr:prepilin-type N-terminal cleavage/methylation domain-containing protein [Planctomycetota bacterium]